MTDIAEISSQNVQLRTFSRSPHVSSKIANGTALLPHLDKRSAIAIRFAELYRGILADLGGETRVSEGVRQLARRAALLSAESERLEVLCAKGDAAFDLELYGTICDRLGRLFTRLGLNRDVIEASQWSPPPDIGAIEPE